MPYRPPNNLRGIGGVVSNGQELGKVNYELQEIQKSKVTDSHDGPSEVPTTKSISGYLKPFEYLVLLRQGSLALRLEDGRSLDFVVTSGNPQSGYQIKGSGLPV